MAAESLSEDELDAVGRVHPSLMGGEYLPDLEAGEVEIARFELESVTADVISLRARRAEGKIHYRLVDEYDTQYEIEPTSSDEPLTFGELVELINNIQREGDLWFQSLRDANREGFIHVSSEYYPQLASYYESEAAERKKKIRKKVGCLILPGTSPRTHSKAPAQGDVDAQAQFDRGILYYYGRGVPQDFALARVWFEKAAAKSYGPAQAALGYLYASGQGVLQDFAKAREWWKQAAAQGQAKAQYNIGTLYAGGRGVSQDFAKAREWYELASAQGYPFAQAALGLLYAKGRSVLQDYSKAKILWEQAAGQGSVDAQVNLGKMYAGGRGVQQDFLKAREWWKRAAAQGDKDAQAHLDWLNDNGLGVPQNYRNRN
jgi:TPR repeat protein